jgi:hypothetical protein
MSSTSTGNTFYNNCRYELLRVVFELESSVNARHPIFTSILVQKLLKTWGMKNIQTIAGYLHDSKLLNKLVPYAWVVCEDEDGTEVITDITHSPPKPYRLIGVEMNLGFAEKPDELLSEDKVKDKESRTFRYLTFIPQGFEVISNPGAPDRDEIQKWLSKPTDFINRCGKTFIKVFDNVIDNHATPQDAAEDMAIQVPSSMIENLKNFGKS